MAATASLLAEKEDVEMKKPSYGASSVRGFIAMNVLLPTQTVLFDSFSNNLLFFLNIHQRVLFFKFPSVNILLI